MADKETISNVTRGRFKDQITATAKQNVITLFDNAKKPIDGTFAVVEQPDDAVWCACHVRFGDSFQADVGAATKRYRTTGVLMVQIFTPLGKGDKDALTLADAVEAAFRTVTDTGVVFRTPSTRVAGQRDNWWQINVNCPFYADNVA